jgi:hypothetical protein
MQNLLEEHSHEIEMKTEGVNKIGCFQHLCSRVLLSVFRMLTYQTGKKKGLGIKSEVTHEND